MKYLNINLIINCFADKLHHWLSYAYDFIKKMQCRLVAGISSVSCKSQCILRSKFNEDEI